MEDLTENLPGGELGGEAPAGDEKVAPRNPGKRQRDALLARVKRKLPNLSEAKLAALDKLEVGELERVLEEGLNPKPAAPVIQLSMEPGQKAGWPPPSVMKEWAELAHLASIVPPFLLEAGAHKVPRLQHWANAFAPRTIKLGSVEHELKPQQQLSEGIAGLLAKHLGSGPGSSPEAQVAIACISVAVFGAMDMAATLMKEAAAEAEQHQKPREEPRIA